VADPRHLGLEREQHVVGDDQPQRAQQAQEAEIGGQGRQQQRDQDDEVDDRHRLAQVLQRARRDVEPGREVEPEAQRNHHVRGQDPLGVGQEGRDQEEGDRRQVEGEQRQLEVRRPTAAAEIELAQPAAQRRPLRRVPGSWLHGTDPALGHRIVPAATLERRRAAWNPRRGRRFAPGKETGRHPR
jgi:hypothetical protein